MLAQLLPTEPLRAEFNWPGHSVAELVQSLGQNSRSNSATDNDLSGDSQHSQDSSRQTCIWETSVNSPSTNCFEVHQPGRYIYLGLETQRCLAVDGGMVNLGPINSTNRNSVRHLQTYDWNPLEPLQTCLDESRNSTSSYYRSLQDKHSQSVNDTPPFIGGWIGYMSYDAARYFERIEGMEGNRSEPDLYVRFIDRLLVIDTKRAKVLLYVWPNNCLLPESSTTEADFFRLEKLVRQVLAQPARATVEIADDLEEQPQYQAKFSREQYVDLVKRAQDYIGAGDIFQVVISNSFSMKQSPEPLEVYDYLRRTNPSPYHFYLPCDQFTLVGASPEIMLRGWTNPQTGGQQVAMRPVAGTYPRGATAAEDAELKNQLANDEKELAEHIMLVDHCRNDMGRTAKIGSVDVSDLCSIEPYKTVFHMVTQVSAHPKDGESALSVLSSCFPIATLTGTPKIRAMEIIAELEGPTRGAFGGAAMQLGFDGFLDSSVIIRTAAISSSGTLLRAGAGIVYDSQPEREYQECLWKAAALAKAIAVVEHNHKQFAEGNNKTKAA